MSWWIFLNSGDFASCSANTSIEALKPASMISLENALSCVFAPTSFLSAMGL